MRNPHGMPIWYELMTPDPEASTAFYRDVIGWSVGPKEDGPVDYRMIDTPQGEQIAGMLRLSPDMVAGGSSPRWLFYIGVDDVDATVAAITGGGGSVHLPAFDMPDVGRMAMVSDPQGTPFYVMRGASDEPSTSWERMGLGKCNWNELSIPDQKAGNAFYTDVFGWSYPDRMTMPDGLGDYVFVAVGDEMIGATMTANDEQPHGWLFYFRAPDIEAAAAKVTAGGGTVLSGPMEVPGGDRIIVATDPAGAAFGVVAPGAQQ